MLDNLLAKQFQNNFKNLGFVFQKQPPEVFYRNRSEACNFIKKEALAQVFSCEFCEIFKNTFFTEHLRMTACGILKSK